MRINAVGPQVVSSPEVRDSVDQVRAPKAVEPYGATVYSGGRVLVESEAPNPATPVIQDRRRNSRRMEDRRKQQIPVLIDTRVSQRRVERRRNDDEPAGAVDVEA